MNENRERRSSVYRSVKPKTQLHLLRQLHLPHRSSAIAVVVLVLTCLTACGVLEHSAAFLQPGVDGTQLRVATYNVHHWRGRDEVESVERIATVIDDLAAPVIALQEIDNNLTGNGDERRQELLADILGRRFVEFDGPDGPRMAAQGNAILIDDGIEVISATAVDISEPDRDPRAFVDVYLDIDGSTLRVLGAHLGLKSGERKRQVRTIAERLASGPPADATLFMGDLNEWSPLARTFRPFRELLKESSSPPSFPSSRPLLRLDRVWADSSASFLAVDVVNTPLASEASDHLPVTASIQY